jgi:hypothetical protein
MEIFPDSALLKNKHGDFPLPKIILPETPAKIPQIHQMDPKNIGHFPLKKRS